MLLIVGFFWMLMEFYWGGCLGLRDFDGGLFGGGILMECFRGEILSCFWEGFDQ